MVSFLSPCVLPLVPAYLSAVTALDAGGRQSGATVSAATVSGAPVSPAAGGVAPAAGGGDVMVARRSYSVVKSTGLFIGGFSLVFILLGLSATALGAALSRDHAVLTRASGAVVVAMAVFMLAATFFESPWLLRERRFRIDPSAMGPLAAPVLGAAFAFGWTPCLGPVLASVLAVAADERRLVAGTALLAAYSAGLGVPFLITGLAYERMTTLVRGIKRHSRAITVAAAGLLGLFGVLLILNRFSMVVIGLEDLLRSVGLGSLIRLG